MRVRTMEGGAVEDAGDRVGFLLASSMNREMNAVSTDQGNSQRCCGLEPDQCPVSVGPGVVGVVTMYTSLFLLYQQEQSHDS